MADNANYTQESRLLSLTTPLGKDVLALGAFNGSERISSLFQYNLDLAALNTVTVDFDKILGQTVNITVLQRDGGQARHFNGIVSRFSAGSRDHEFTNYRAEVVPKLWLLTKRHRSRIFQHISVPDILKKVLSGIDTTFEIQGTFHPRDYCVQYRETDFEFISRLMAEEGIYFFFTHTAGSHRMIVANTPQSHPQIEGETELMFEEISGGARPEERIHTWEKRQELRSGKVTLWDHCFELPHKHLEAERSIQETLQVGTVTHKLKIAGNEQLEIYDYPGAYAQRFDGVNAAGGETPEDIQRIFEDNKRTANIRMDQEAVLSIETVGVSSCTNIVSGHRFKLTNHHTDNGMFVVTALHTQCQERATYRSTGADTGDDFRYTNQFTCVPFSLPFRPQSTPPKPFIHGTQTAVVVGPAGEEIYTDKYGRVKVQFHWDQEGKNDAQSSCWIRVGMPWAGKNWGFFSLPRIGHEVVVAFEEGDPDRPIIVGSVYNADMMPPYKLPDNKTRSTFKSRSSKGGGGFNEIRYEDKKGSEQVFHHAEKNLDIRVKNNRMENIGNDRHLVVKRDRVEETTRDHHRKTGRDWIEEVVRDRNLKVGGKEAIDISQSHSYKVGGAMTVSAGGNYALDASNIYLKAQNIVLEGTMGLTINVGGNFVTINPSGVQINGTMVMLNSGGSAIPGTPGTIVPPATPAKPVDADDDTPGGHKEYSNSGSTQAAVSGSGSGSGGGGSNRPARSDAPSHDPNATENKDKKHWIEIVLEDDQGAPIPGEYYEIKLPDGTTVDSGTLDEKGRRRVENIDPGNCIITFPRIDKTALKRK